MAFVAWGRGCRCLRYLPAIGWHARIIAAALGLDCRSALVVGVAGMLGDLAESLFKRDMGRKTRVTWLPGFGGVLDLLDSILFAAPVAYLCWLALGELAVRALRRHCLACPLASPPAGMTCIAGGHGALLGFPRFAPIYRRVAQFRPSRDAFGVVGFSIMTSRRSGIVKRIV